MNCKNIHYEKTLADFMAKQQCLREPCNFVQWRMYLFADYSATESVFVFKCHHSLADITAQILMLFNLQDEPKMSEMPHLTSNISTMMYVLNFLLLPMNIFWCSFLTVVCLPKELNGFKTPEIYN